MKSDTKGPWIALYAKTIYSETFNHLTCAERSVFLQGFFLAARMEYDCSYGGHFYHLLPGQFVISLRDLAKQCGEGCSLKIVRSTIDKLERAQTWAHSRAGQGAQSPSLITFINWSVYQHPIVERAQQGAQQGAQLGHTDSPQSLLKSEENHALQGSYKVYTQTREKNMSVLSPETLEVLAYLNEKVKRNFKNPGDIPARLKEYSVQDCKTVIDKKCAEWLGTDMARHLDPVTLFRPSNFDRYLNQVEVSQEMMTFDQWLDKNPEMDYRQFKSDLAAADGFMRAFNEAKKNRLVYFGDGDYAMYQKAIRIKTRETKAQVGGA